MCHVLLCHVMSYVMSCHVSCPVMSCHMSCRVMCHVMCHVMSCVMSCHVICHVMSCVMSCHVMSCHGVEWTCHVMSGCVVYCSIHQVLGPRLFTTSGHAYQHLFNISLCGGDDVAVCSDNMTTSNDSTSTDHSHVSSALVTRVSPL